MKSVASWKTLKNVWRQSLFADMKILLEITGTTYGQHFLLVCNQ